MPEEIINTNADDLIDEKKNSETPNYIELFSDTELEVSDLLPITRSAPTKIIVLAGEEDAGKTTLIACLNDCFQKGPFAKYIFAGSRTLPALEERSFLSRINSGRKEAHTGRTQSNLDNIKFLHISVRKEDLDGSIINLLFTDISGENFRYAKNTTEDCKKLWVLPIADYFVLLLDVGKLDNPAERHKARKNGLLLLQNCCDSGMLNKQSNVDVIFSKCDYLINSKSQIQTQTFIEEIRSTIQNKFQDKFSKLHFFDDFAVRPKKHKQYGDGYGLDRVFLHWMEDNNQNTDTYQNQLDIKPDMREFSLFNYDYSFRIGEK